MANVQRGLITRNDVAWYDGVTRTDSRVDATGGTVTGLNFGDEVDVLQVFGSGTSRTLSSINDAISRLGGASATLLFSTGTWTITDNLTIPSTITCHIPAGTIFSVSSGKTLTFSGPVIREWDDWTAGSGTVTVSIGAANLVDIQDSNYAATNVEDALAELASSANGEGASIIGFEDSAGNFSATDVEAALAELASTAASAEVVTKVKTIAKSINSNTTLESDNQLIGWSLDANKHYEITGFIKYNQNVGNLKFDFSFTNAQVYITVHAGVTDVTGTSEQIYNQNIVSSPISITSMPDGSGMVVVLHGIVKSNVSTGGTVDFRWAQETSSGNNTSVTIGSWISFRKMD